MSSCGCFETVCSMFTISIRIRHYPHSRFSLPVRNIYLLQIDTESVWRNNTRESHMGRMGCGAAMALVSEKPR